MLEAHYVIYLGLLMVSWLLSISLCMRGQRRYLPLCVLLSVTFWMELSVYWLYANGIEFVWIYHIYVLFEYTLLCIYFMQITSKKYHRVIQVSIGVFVVASLSISYWYYQFKSFPGANINTAGVLLCVLCTYALMTLDIRRYDAIFKHPDFWISLGLLIFYGGTFFSNGLYSYLYTIDPVQAKKLFAIINKPLNLILYSCFIIGFICAIPRRSTIRLS